MSNGTDKTKKSIAALNRALRIQTTKLGLAGTVVNTLSTGKATSMLNKENIAKEAKASKDMIQARANIKALKKELAKHKPAKKVTK